MDSTGVPQRKDRGASQVGERRWNSEEQNVAQKESFKF
jgi:hypothetical protein